MMEYLVTALSPSDDAPHVAQVTAESAQAAALEAERLRGYPAHAIVEHAAAHPAVVDALLHVYRVIAHRDGVPFDSITLRAPNADAAMRYAELERGYRVRYVRCVRLPDEPSAAPERPSLDEAVERLIRQANRGEP